MSVLSNPCFVDTAVCYEASGEGEVSHAEETPEIGDSNVEEVFPYVLVP